MKIKIRLIILSAFIFGCAKNINAQNTFPSTGNAGIGTTTPLASAALEIKSTSEGLLIPRMTKAQRDAVLVSTTAKGLLIYQTDNAPGFYYYSGTAWTAISAKGANTTLSNLKTTAIDSSLYPAVTNSISLGSSSLRWKDVNLYNLKFSNGTTQTTAFVPYTAGTGISISGTTITNTAAGANTSLSNLTATSVNQSLVPSSNNSKSLGSSSKAWKNIYFDSLIYFNNQKFISADTITSSTFAGIGAGNNNTTGNSNTAFGRSALSANNTGNYNTAIGTDALLSNTKGANNTVEGSYALVNNSEGSYNAATGSDALHNNTTGSYNTAYGAEALFTNNTGNNNVAIGGNTLHLNTTGYSNVSIGMNALYSNTTGHNLVAIGDSALYNQGVDNNIFGNTAVGSKALYSNTLGYENTATGFQSLYSNSIAADNTATGFQSLYSNSTGQSNTATGFQSLYSNSTGDANTANGLQALYSNGTGTYNTANGFEALTSNTIGFNNTGTGDFALSGNTTGVDNTAMGNEALEGNGSGSNNTALGSHADVTNNNLIDATALGYSAVVDANYKVRVGNTSITSIGGQVGWTSFSDGRYKKNIKEDVKGLVFIDALRPITYTVDLKAINDHYDVLMKTRPDSMKQKIRTSMKEAENAGSKIIYNGFIAQDVEKAAAKLNYNFSGVDKPATKDGLYGLRYSDFVVPLVKAVQELSSQNDSLKNQSNLQQNQINDLQNQINELKAMIVSNQSTLNNQQAIVVSSSSLQQNVPNPFTNATAIGYTLPQKFSSAQIIITDKSGATLKAINISGSGKGNLNVEASTLASGAYQYSLMIDGRLIATKQMVIAK